MEIVFSKILTETDIRKRLSVQTAKKRCFLDFSDQHKVRFGAIDSKGNFWPFVCSVRKTGYPKPVLSKGWLQFVHSWQLAIGDKVIIHRKQDKSGKGQYRIEVIRRETQPSAVLSPPVQNQEADRTMGVASYSNIESESTITNHILDQPSYSNTEEEPTTTSYSINPAISYDSTEGLLNQTVTDRGDLNFEFISLESHIKDKEPKLIDFFKLGSQEHKENRTLTTSSTAPYFNFL